jgi:hypothetical protein
MIDSFEDFFISLAAPYLVDQLRGYHSKMEALIEEAYNQNDIDVVDYYLNFPIFISILRYSIITSAYAIFERALHELCELVREKKYIGMRFYHLEKKNGELERCRMYLKKHTGVDISHIDHWTFINNINKVRNAIVHANGFLFESDHRALVKKLRNVAPNLEGINLKDEDGTVRISVERPFCEELISKVDKTITNICEPIFNAIY